MSIEAMKQSLEALKNNRQAHYYCEDTWYSCPKHEDGCANDFEGSDCNCGADKANIEIDAAIKALEEALKQEQGEPVATVVARQYDDGTHAGNALDWEGRNCENDFPVGTKFYTTPQQRKPLTHEQRFDLLTQFEPQKNKWEAPAILIDMVEAAHGIKE
jgi:hypothetical protein